MRYLVAAVGARRRRVLGIVGVLGLATTVALVGPALAHEDDGYPARIHEGTCENLGRVAFRLNGVGATVDLNGTPIATPVAVNPDSSNQVMVSDTSVDGQLSDLLADTYAVMVYASDEDMSAIACGNIGGVMRGAGLITGLSGVGTPAPAGFAIFQPEGDGTRVSIILEPGLAPVAANGGATPTADDRTHDETENHDDVATPAA